MARLLHGRTCGALAWCCGRFSPTEPNPSKSSHPRYDRAFTSGRTNQCANLPPPPSSRQLAAREVMEGRRLTIPPSTPARVARLIERCWTKEREERPSFHEICVALERILLQGPDKGPLISLPLSSFFLLTNPLRFRSLFRSLACSHKADVHAKGGQATTTIDARAKGGDEARGRGNGRGQAQGLGSQAARLRAGPPEATKDDRHGRC